MIFWEADVNEVLGKEEVVIDDGKTFMVSTISVKMTTWYPRRGWLGKNLNVFGFWLFLMRAVVSSTRASFMVNFLIAPS